MRYTSADIIKDDKNLNTISKEIYQTPFLYD